MALLSTLGGEILIVALIALVLFLIFKIGKFILKIIFGLVMNSVLGLVALWVLGTFFGTTLPLGAGTVIPIALFGLPALGTLLIASYFKVVFVVLLAVLI